MGSETVPTFLRGFILHDDRISESSYDSSSTATQMGPRPGVAEPQQGTSMALEPSGTMLADTYLRIRTVRPGFPGDTAEFVWNYLGDNDSEHRYWDPPVLMTDYETVDLTTTAGRWRFPHAIKLASGVVLVSVTYDTASVRLWKRSTAGVWSTIAPSAGASVTDPSPAYSALLQLPSGRVLCFHWTQTVGTTAFNIGAMYSDDDGATWTAMSSRLIASNLSTVTNTPRRLRCSYLDGRILVLAECEQVSATENQIRQYASADLGASLTLIETLEGTGTDSVSFPDVVVHKGQFVVGYVSDEGASIVPSTRTIPNAFTPLSDATAVEVVASGDALVWGTTSGGVFTDGDFSVWSDEDNVLWAIGRDHTGGQNMPLLVRYSTDDGATWQIPGSSGAAAGGNTVIAIEDAASYLFDLAAVPVFGEVLVLHRAEADPATSDDSLRCLHLGGYTSPRGSAYSDGDPDTNYDRLGHLHTWVPIDTPDAGVWTLGTTGAPTVTLVQGGLSTVAAGGEASVYTRTGITATLAQGIRANCRVLVSTATDGFQVRLRLSDATPLQYHVYAIVTATAITLYDFNAAANLGTVATGNATSGVEIRVSLTSTSASLYYRTCDAADNDRAWILAGSGAPTSSAANDGNRIVWGTYASTSSVCRFLAYTSGAYMGEEDARGRPYMPHPVYVSAGVSITAIDGPTVPGDVWNLDTAYSHPVDHLDPIAHPSPRKPWRSVADSSQMDLRWSWGTEATRFKGALLGVYLGACNIGQAELWGKDAAGTWAKLYDLDLRAGSGMYYTREGATVLASTATTGELWHYMPHDALRDWSIKLDTGVVRKITASSSGSWTQAQTTLAPRLTLSGILATEPTSGTGAALWARNYAAVFPVSTAYRGFGLRIPSQATADGYYQIGVFLMGQFLPFGRQYSWGHASEISPTYELTETRSGIRSGKRRGPARRAKEIAWPDGVDASKIQIDKPNADYVAAYTAGPAVAIPGATGFDLDGVMQALAGASDTLVFLPRVPALANSADLEELRHPEHMMYGRLRTETFRRDHVLGNEWTNPGEVHRLGTLRIEEET